MQLVSSDLCTVTPTGPQGQRYFLTLVDKHTGYTVVSVICHKSQVEHELPTMVAVMERQSGHKLTTLRTDNGGEYMSAGLQEFMRMQGIRHELTVPYSPQQNGAAERMNDTILTRTRCIMHDMQAPRTLWPELVLAVTHVHNL
jgi:transposase InsO family protein